MIAITMGDPAGIGPEIILKFIRRDTDGFVVIGSLEVLNYYNKKLKIVKDISNILTICKTKNELKKAIESGDSKILLDLGPVANLHPGKDMKESGEAAFSYIYEAVKLTNLGYAKAITTAPISKRALNLAGHHYNGHTELLADLTNAKHAYMMLYSNEMIVTHVTTHIALSDVSKKVNKENIKEAFLLTLDFLKKLKPKPRIVVACVDPHCGEGGVIGICDENKTFEASKELKLAGYEVFGPFPSDTVFLRCLRKEFDAVIAMYHDQGHIPMKLVGFDEGVNVTLGLSILRTSVDHGTAYDIVEKGVAREKNLVEAFNLAKKITS
ncbi:MAG TPA: 4-hydroxythreonine-4-phosphate dehydrogenase PdxA [Thermotogaceae bacterium]|nr:4-hydroxythreonine-4-phosphate dehydrogenase PdxA [Thermotogaceae bacterium]